MGKESINIVWFKRDLRLRDHASLVKASNEQAPTLLLYLFEPMLIESNHYGDRHWRFVFESLVEMQQELQDYNLKLHIACRDASELFRDLNRIYKIKCVFSHEETGIDLTFKRDKKLKK